MAEQLDYNDIMAEAARDAVKYVHREYQFALDYSEESVAEMEKSLTHIHRVLVTENTDPIDPKMVVTISNWYGAYLGEVFRRHHGGDWGIDNRDPEAPAFEVKYNDLGMAFPSRVFHRIMGGKENDINEYYREISKKVMKLEIKEEDEKWGDLFENQNPVYK